MKDLIKNRITESIDIKSKLLLINVRDIEKVTKVIISAFKKGNKVFLCGNGGSAADAQHIAGELECKLYLDRDPMPAIALHCNTSSITAIGNDLGFDKTFSRKVEALGEKGDVLIALSTSGASPNILEALEIAKKKGLKTVGFTGKSGGKMKGLCEILIKVPSDNTPRIQEAHILIGHIICEIVERELYGTDKK